MEFHSTLKDIYSAWLGKNIGIRLGAPVENWTHEQIKETYGSIDRYVCDYEPCFASDDDANGPAYFVKALDYNCSKDITAEELSLQILNILSEGHGFFWWGGKGIATEHTAYLNLLDGMLGPESGSEKVNGKDLSEQIGGQIFSDCWGYVAYDDALLAADLAGKMASAMHDLDGIEGARYVAACISLAFKIKDANQIVRLGLNYIDENSTYAKLVQEIIDLYDHNMSQEECLNYILNNHGYDRYPGVCHILPNTAIMVMSLLYGENDFSKTMTMLCDAGWDTDCTCGNVGSIMGAMVGVNHIDSKWIVPIKDRFIGSSLIGTWNIDTLSRQAYYFTYLAYKLKGLNTSDFEDYLSQSNYKFELPYGIQGFECDSYRGFESNLIQRNNTLTCIINNAFLNETLHIYKKTYYRPNDLYDVRYQPSFSPLVYPNETITFKLEPYENVMIRPYAKGRDKTYFGDYSNQTEFSLKLEASDDVILEVGLELKAMNRIMHEYIQINEVNFDGNVDCMIDFRKETMNDYGLDYGGLGFKEINQCTTLRQNSWVDTEGLHIKNDRVVFGNANLFLKELSFECAFENEIEIGFGSTGRINYDSLTINNKEIVVNSRKNNKKGFTFTKNICKIRTGNLNSVKLSFKDNKLYLMINDERFEFEHECNAGSIFFQTSHSANFHWCRFVMTNTHI